MVAARRIALAVGVAALIAGIVALSAATATYISLIVGGAILIAVMGGFEIRAQRRKLASMKGKPKGKGGGGKRPGSPPAGDIYNAPVGSVNQKGGKTEQTNYFGSQPRTIVGRDQLGRVVKPLIKYQGTVVTVRSTGEHEAQSYAAQLRDALATAGWAVRYVGHSQVATIGGPPTAVPPGVVELRTHETELPPALAALEGVLAGEDIATHRTLGYPAEEGEVIVRGQ
jgi:hypothetical protein